MNKIFRFLMYVMLHLSTFIQVYLLSMFIASPVLCIVYTILDRLYYGYLLTGKFGYAWLSLSALISIPTFIRVEYRAHKARK